VKKERDRISEHLALFEADPDKTRGKAQPPKVAAKALRATWESAWANTASQPAAARSVTPSEWREEIWSTYDCRRATDQLFLIDTFRSVRVDVGRAKGKGIGEAHPSLAQGNGRRNLAFVPKDY
jgi:hypothetical protein